MSTEPDVDSSPADRLRALAADRSRVAIAPDWYRMPTSAAIARLDPGLEGWELTRALVSGAALVSE